MLLTQSTIGHDVKTAWRGLYRSPTFTAVAVIALALGIGANTAIFSVVNAVLLNPLRYERSSDLVRIWSSWTQFPQGSVSEPEYYDYRESDSIEALAAFTFPHDATLAVEGGEPEPVTRTFVTASLFRVLGGRALHGRAFEDEENQTGKGDVVVLSHGLWQRKFASDPGILGKMILGEGLRTAGLGLVLGLLASTALSRALASVPGLLHGVSAMDLPTYAGVVVLLSTVVLLASFAPASRASRIAPVEALRYE